MQKSGNRRQTGADYEELACRYLRAQGYRIRQTNYRCRQGEIDIVAMDGQELVFIEVKYRASESGGGPLSAVTYRKQRTISRVALYYLFQHHLPDTTPCRFDVIGITDEKVTLIKDAFDYTP